LLANAFFWRKKIPSHVEMGTKNGSFGKKMHSFILPQNVVAKK